MFLSSGAGQKWKLGVNDLVRAALPVPVDDASIPCPDASPDYSPLSGKNDAAAPGGWGPW